VLFADVTGSTALGESLDPEDVRALFARYYAVAREVVAAHGGTLAKFIGDAVMAVFGLPHAHGDDAERALSAALELRDGVRAEPQLAERMPLRLGVNTGEVVATREWGAGEFLITGDAVNVAARLEQAAEPWAILCGERTARAAGGAFAFGPATDVEARGKSAPVRAFPLLSRVRRARVQRIPLVGREADLAQLELVARRAFTERRPFLVSLIAPAGTGKTRLLEEFLDGLPALEPSARVAAAQCLPYGERLTFGPLRAVLHRLAEVAEDAPAGAVLQGVREWLRGTGVEAPDRVTQLLAATVGLGEAEVPDRTALFGAWRAAVEAASRRSPLVVVFEDLHWSSESLLDLVEFVMAPRADSPVLMIALARPELLDRRPAWGGGRRNYVSLALEPLGESAVVELVEHLLGRQAPEIAARVVARSEGNPFYAGEIIRTVLDRLPDGAQDPAAVERALATLPDTVQATVLARLDLLAPRERRALQVGAVFGRAFPLAGLAAVDPELASETGAVAERLLEKDLVRSANGDGYAFRHILIREVAYQTLPRAERWRLHAAAGRWLEASTAGREEPVAELIAFHYQEAATLSSAAGAAEGEVEEIRAKAVEWLSRAADVASAGAALGEAARHLRAAIQLARTDERPDLYERLGRVTGGDASADAYRTALELCRDAGRPADQQIRVLAGLLTMITRFQGAVGRRPSEEELESLRAEGRRLVAWATDERARAVFWAAEAFLPFWHFAAGILPSESELAEADANARRALEVAERLDDARLASAALDGIGSLAQNSGDWHEARRIATRRLAFGERLDLSERMDAYAVATWSSGLVGDLEEAERVSAAGLAQVQPGQVPAWTLHVLAWRIYSLTLLGRWDEVLSAGERACQLWRESGVTAGYAVRGFIPALDVARARGDSRREDELREVLGEILRRVPASSPAALMTSYLADDLDALVERVLHGFRLHNPEYPERTLALCADLRHPPDVEAIRPVLDFATAGRLRILEAQARRTWGLAEADAAQLGRALEIFEATGAMPYAARARCERALLTGDETELAAGRAALEALGDGRYLERLERDVSRARAGA
jgi:class 3 adenylate cyclase